ncbi:MAG: trypsin-like peptidase domain-containing protein [Pirellulales bacterium]|nr:trypsin-like peptidase domain-containing protein [Pirellulales bacterium]
MRKAFLLCTVSALLGALLAIALYDPPDSEQSSVAQEAGNPEAPVVIRLGAPGGSPEAARPLTAEELTPEERVNVAVYEGANRSAVNINTRSIQTDPFMMFERTAEGEGSGTVVDEQGHILTNFHVVDGAREIQVTLFDGSRYRSYDAQLVGGDPGTDVAVLKIEAPPEVLFPVVFGSSTGLKVGQRVFAIGNPFGLERTLSTGIISSLNRSLPGRRTQRKLKSIIQIDAAINPGNSGGPLLDSRGRMIGMNTAIASKTGESAGVGFAIPVNTIARIVPQLIEHGHVIRPDIGIERVVEMDRGLLIGTLTPGGPAEQAGLQGLQVIRRRVRQGMFVYEKRSLDWAAADVIVAVDGVRVRTVDDLLTVIEEKQPGQEVAVTVLRDNQQRQVGVKLVAGE